MAVYHRTQRLQIFGEKPEIQKLYGSRYRMVVRCVAKNDTKAWYDDNKSQIFADFGSLYSAQMSVDGIDARTGEAYDDMVLVKNEATYTRSGEYVIIFTYETLTDSFVQEAEDKVDFDLNGLKRLTRTIIARGTVAYSSTVGTTTIVGSSPLLTLAQVSEDQLEASEDGFKRIQEVWLESGTLSETLDNVGSQKAKVIETIGADPATPSGYSLASKQESDFEGFQTNRFTFLKNNVVLSESEDKVGSQLAIVKEVFNGTPTTPSGYSLANEQESDVDGIPTRRYTFLKDNVELSRSEDKVGSQLAIVTQVFNPTSDPTETGYSIARTEVSDVDGIPTKSFTFLKNNVVLSESEDKVGSQLAITQEVFNGTPYSPPSGYSIANTQGSDVDGIPTKRFTFLKPSILSLQQDFNNGLKRVSVQAFGMTSAAVSSELTAITGSHELISQTESDYEGIKTSTFQYQLDESFTEDYELNGLKRISIVELSTTNFTARDIGVEGVAATPQDGLYLGAQDIDNGGAIKVRRSTWVEAGVISVSTDEDSILSEVVVDAINLTVTQVRTKVSEVTANHSIRSQTTRDYEGLNNIRYVFDIRSTTTETELGDSQIGVEFETGIQTDGSSDFIITRKYAISSANTTSSIKKLIPPEINDPVFDGTGGTQKAYIVDQEVKPNGQDGAVLTRTFAMLPTHLDEWDEMVVRFPGVSRGPFQLDEGFAFRSEPYSEAVPVRICRDFYLSNPQRICRPDEFRPVDENGNRVAVLTADTVPTADEYIGYVNSGKYLNDRVSIHRWQGDIWERRIVQFKAE
jgi:hypothetical protein